MEEAWLPIAGFEASHEVSNFGHVRTTARREHILAPKVGRGYYRAVLTVKGTQHVRLIHRLVAEMFLGPAPSDRHQVNHIDGDKLNNRADNLEWCTASENGKHAYRVGLSVSRKGSQHGRAKLNEEQIAEIRSLRGIVPHRVLAARFGVQQTHISRIMRGVRWAHVG